MIASPTTFADPHGILESTPHYRVNFWERSPGADGWNLDAFVLAGASDVAEVTNWIERHRRGRRVELFVEVGGGPVLADDVPRRSGLIRLSGEDPNDGVSVPIGVFVPTATPRH